MTIKWWAWPTLQTRGFKSFHFGFELVGQVLEGASFADGFAFAVFFSELDDEGVVLVKKGDVVFEAGVKQLLYLLVAAAGFEESVPAEDAGGIGIYDEEGFIVGVQADRGGCFRADTF